MIARATWCEAREPESYPRLGRPTALVVDHATDTRAATAETLERCGFTVFTAGSAREVEQVTAGLAGPLDLLVTAVSLPDAQGEALALLVRREGLRPPVLYLSDRPWEEPDAGWGPDSEGVVVSKPVEELELERRVQRVLGL